METLYTWLITATVAAVTAVAAAHAAIYKRDTRAAVGWIGLILALPLGGALIYLMLGVNRIQRRAVALRKGLTRYRSIGPAASLQAEDLTGVAPHLAQLARVTDGLVDAPRTAGNRVQPLASGGEAYEQMLDAIARAEETIALSTYIFDHDSAGEMFTEALAAAVARGAEARVLIDAVGARYSRPSILRSLRRAGVRTAPFLRPYYPWRLAYLNLRNHRKLLITDGRVAFTGGMNIRAGHLLERSPRHPVRDLHFRVEGPVVATLREVFAEDWTFTTGEVLAGEPWFPPLVERGEVIARGIADGPDEDFEALRWTMLGALTCAQRSIRVVTPYFIPDAGLLSALGVAARRGVDVEIFLPERVNLRLVQWASTSLMWRVLETGCRVYLTPPPFDHTKLLLIDGSWALIGTANWDPRSLRLNFEIDLECYSDELAAELGELVAARRAAARALTLEEVEGRSLPVRLRDGLARLWSPFL